MDLWTNALFAFAVLAAERLWVAPSPRWVVVSCAAVLAAIYSKMTLWPLCGVMGLLSAAIILHQCRRGRLPWKALAFYALAGGLLAPLWPLHLWLTYGSPFFPYPNPLDPSAPSLPINPSYTLSRSRACWASLNIAPELRDWSTPHRFIWSFFELTRLMTDKPMYWIMGQYAAGSPNHRMGGFDGVTMAAGTVIIAVGAWREKALRFSALLLLGLVIVTAFTMESHEMRYFMYIPIVMMPLVARSCALSDRVAVFVKMTLLPLAFASPLFLSGRMVPSPPLANGVPAVYKTYWKALDGYIAKHGVPDRPFCRPDIGPPVTTDKCEIKDNILFSRALAAGPNLSTYHVADWCVSDTPKLAPPRPKAKNTWRSATGEAP